MLLAGIRQRILRATAASLSWQPQGADGEPADPGVVTVSVTAADGTVVIPAGTATVGAATAPRSVAVTAGQTGQLDELTATWTVGQELVAESVHEIVGGYYFTSADLRDVEPSTSDAAKDTTVRILEVRAEVEALFESACAAAFVPRFAVWRTSMAGAQVLLPYPFLRVVRWVRFWSDGDTYVSVTPEVVAGYPPNQEGILDFSAGWRYDGFPLDTSYAGRSSRQTRRVDIAFEHGLDAPPADLKRAALTYARAQVNRARAAVPDRATSMQLPDGGSVTLATPGVGRWHTGIPSVDEVLRRYNYHNTRIVAG